MHVPSPLQKHRVVTGRPPPFYCFALLHNTLNQFRLDKPFLFFLPECFRDPFEKELSKFDCYQGNYVIVQMWA